ncbi:MAG: hypothetical protein A2Y62_19805 [Candidatus Fischerbacteria bacterium RBG_13_37_8]|uniref:PIN domain-containing protein n=1 Tax=Candidatus Fischerbacteria bacterium RBG_13_37_8 TaxID=1817863 RepID=A0A1F5VL05_9BACT|nr:MAG: hypothetical protein A2Y62_19805 [Candidatus Fischerbacteria bacterium RBG_13_37_8]
MKKLPDTNTILSYFLHDNKELFQEAFHYFEKVRTGEERAVVLECVFTEIVYVLIKFYKVPRMEISDKLKEFMLYRGIVNEDKDELNHALDIFSSSNLSIVDCILCAKAKSINFGIFSFDEKLNKLSKKEK